MGTTIRRQPVNFDIPNSPDYRFLNITNFRGLDVSSNPFELATNTASDCLNVYVDETNTLTTRPRLQRKFEYSMGQLLNAEIIQVSSCSKGYLILYKDLETQRYKLVVYEFEKYMLNFVDAKDTSLVPKTKFEFIEQGDDFYILDGQRYLHFKWGMGATLTEVQGYVPTTAIVDLNGNKHPVEHVNLLSNKYLEKYEWFYDTKLGELSGEFSNNTFTIPDVDRGPFNNDVNFAFGTSGSYDGIYVRDEYGNDLSFIALGASSNINPRNCIYTYNHHSKILWGTDPSVNVVFAIYEYNNDWTYAIAGYQGYSLSGDITQLINSDGNKIILKNNATNDFMIYTLNMDIEDFDVEHKTPKYDGSPFFIGNYIAFSFADRLYVYVNIDEDPVNIVGNKPLDYINITQKNIILCKDSSGIFYTYDINTSSTTEQFINFQYSHIDVIDGYGESLWYCDKQGQIQIIPDINEINKNHVFSGITLSNTTLLKDSYMRNDYTFFHNNSHEVSRLAYNIFERKSFTEPTITLTKKSNTIPDWLQKRQTLLKSKLITRFDNNYWLASGNEYYRSQNNDPTYFPITEYNALGDVNEHITGFNISNDTSLLIYKENSLYLIQPYYSEATGSTEYSVTESKNTVGNTAIGAPIVTTLTEIPLQINYDGIYGLSQLKNVSAVERIADLMSEPINERWLNEDNELIKKAQTLNRLYWTYIILPCDDKTKVYLLDNRTNSWYYWELPIKLLNSFVKDNRTELVDTDGNIYYLTSEDIENTNFDNVLITEYYDDGKKIIPWFWQSQILYLGTMNYSKRLVNTTFILTDTQDGYGLQYSFKVFRKLASSVPEKELTGELNLVRSTTKKTNISKFGFIQLRMSNITEESQGTEAEKAFRNNKLRLVGLGLKYVLLEGLIR